MVEFPAPAASRTRALLSAKAARRLPITRSIAKVSPLKPPRLAKSFTQPNILDFRRSSVSPSDMDRSPSRVSMSRLSSLSLSTGETLAWFNGLKEGESLLFNLLPLENGLQRPKSRESSPIAELPGPGSLCNFGKLKTVADVSDAVVGVPHPEPVSDDNGRPQKPPRRNSVSLGSASPRSEWQAQRATVAKHSSVREGARAPSNDVQLEKTAAHVRRRTASDLGPTYQISPPLKPERSQFSTAGNVTRRSMRGANPVQKPPRRQFEASALLSESPMPLQRSTSCRSAETHRSQAIKGNRSSTMPPYESHPDKSRALPDPPRLPPRPLGKTRSVPLPGSGAPRKPERKPERRHSGLFSSLQRRMSGSEERQAGGCGTKSGVRRTVSYTPTSEGFESPSCLTADNNEPREHFYEHILDSGLSTLAENTLDKSVSEPAKEKQSTLDQREEPAPDRDNSRRSCSEGSESTESTPEKKKKKRRFGGFLRQRSSKSDRPGSAHSPAAASRTLST